MAVDWQNTNLTFDTARTSRTVASVVGEPTRNTGEVPDICWFFSTPDMGSPSAGTSDTFVVRPKWFSMSSASTSLSFVSPFFIRLFSVRPQLEEVTLAAT